MKITQVEKQKKNPHRYNIFLDGEFAFGADEDTVVNFRLVKGREIASDQLEKILFETEVGKLMERMYQLFTIRQRSEKEVRDYFRIKNYELKIKEKEEIPELVIETLIKKLKDKGMLNDKEFAKAWMESRRKNKKKGKAAIKRELFQKGIDREIIEEVLDDETSAISEQDLAKQALEKKLRVWKNLSEMEFKKKALEFLVRRGFDYSTAKDVVNDFLPTSL